MLPRFYVLFIIIKNLINIVKCQQELCMKFVFMHVLSAQSKVIYAFHAWFAKAMSTLTGNIFAYYLISIYHIMSFNLCIAVFVFINCLCC